jgi:hypothetical protein
VLHALVGQSLDDHFGTGHFPCHVRRPFPRAASALPLGNKKGPQGAMFGRLPMLPRSGRRGRRPNADYDKNIARHGHRPNFHCARYSDAATPGQASVPQKLILAKDGSDHICEIVA